MSSSDILTLEVLEAALRALDRNVTIGPLLIGGLVSAM